MAQRSKNKKFRGRRGQNMLLFTAFFLLRDGKDVVIYKVSRLPRPEKVVIYNTFLPWGGKNAVIQEANATSADPL